MEYRVTVKSNPRIVLLYALIILIPLAAILLLALGSPIVGVVILLLGGYIDYHLVKFARLQVNSYVRTDEEGIHGRSAVAETVNIAWDQVTHAGVCRESEKRLSAFVYDENLDQLIAVPSDYESFNQFVAELEERFELLRFQMGPADTPADKLREHLNLDAPGEAESEEQRDEEDSDT